MIIFCPSCGSKNEYASIKPSSCNKCGGGFNISTSNPSFRVRVNDNASFNRTPTYDQVKFSQKEIDELLASVPENSKGIKMKFSKKSV